MRNLALAIAVVAMLAAGAGWAATHESKAKPTAHSRTPEQALARAVTPARLKAHLSALESIARRNGGTRAVGTRGYTQSVAYVASQLRKAGYRPRLNRFSFDFFRETRPTVFDRVSPGLKHYSNGPDFITMRYSGGGNVTAQVAPVDLTSVTSGCESSDFARFPTGAIALMRRGGCPFSQKAGNAESHAAAAALLANDGLPGRTAPLAATIFGPGVRIPALVVSSQVADELARLAQLGTVRVHLNLSVATTRARAVNVIADLPGRKGGFVLLGGHLDSVAAGPGINDNGSGSALVLEVARQARRLHIRPTHGLRFAFWGGEELGLLGSTSYVQGLSGRARKKILDVLNFDMVGSPNSGRIVYAGRGEARGSTRIERAFRAYFNARRLPYEVESLGGASDYAAFSRAGIPVGGLFTGADDLKTAAQARTFGGTANRPFDSCYHKACDTVANVDVKMLEQLADAGAVVALRLAR